MTDNEIKAIDAIRIFQKAVGYTAEAVIKALDCCRGNAPACDECPFTNESGCDDMLKQIAADKIKKLIDKLKVTYVLTQAYKVVNDGILPCKVGDEVWAIRTYGNGTKVPQKGKVSEMYYIDESMRLCIVVKGVCRGEWGKRVFATLEDADRYLQANKIEDV